MKSFKIFSAIAVCMAISTFTIAQSKTETFKVSGNCGMCKNNIEKAAKSAGAESALWNKDTKELTVTYNSSTTNTAKIQQKIADVGYDNVGFTATVEAYNKLHGCCKYERKELKAETKASCCKGGEEKCNHDQAAKADCCKDGKCTKEGHNGKDCCKEGKCTKEGHEGKDCCKKAE